MSRAGVGGVYHHPVSACRLRDLCAAAWVQHEVDDIWRAIEGHDLLALGVARLLLLTDPRPVPLTTDEGWTCYAARLWRPGKPHQATWPAIWRAAVEACAA